MMRFMFALLVFIMGPILSKSQSINCMIFIDGKLPQGSSLKCSLEIIDNLGDTSLLIVDYVIGEFRLDEKGYSFLSMLEANKQIKFKLEYLDWENQKFLFERNLRKEWFFNRYLILRVTTFRKKEMYLFGVSTPDFSTAFSKKEYNMIDDN